MDSFTSPSEDSVEYVPKPRVMRAKPIPVPAPYDPGEDFELLKKLQQYFTQIIQIVKEPYVIFA